MAVTVASTTSAYATYPGSRRAAYTSTGRLWVALHNGASTRFEFWYSDDGTTFTEATSLRITAGTPTHVAFTIDRSSNRAVFATDATQFRMVENITSSSSWTTGAASLPNVRDVCTFVRPGSTDFHVAFAWSSFDGVSAYTPRISVYRYTTAHVAVGSPYSSELTGAFGYTHPQADEVCIDFRHTGNGYSVASSSPDLYVAWVAKTGSGATYVLASRRYPWDGSTWSAGTARDHGATLASARLTAAFDGTWHCMVWADDSVNTTINVAQRDASDTTSTFEALTSLSDGAVTDLSVSYTSIGDPIIHAVGTTSDDLKRNTYRRATATWDGWSTIEATTVVNGTLYGTKSWQPGLGIALGWQEGSFNVRSETDFVNTAPSAPTWASPVTGRPADRGAALTLDWTFVDIDTPGGDAQTAYALQKSVNGGAVTWWTGSTWGTETKITTATTSLTLASGWATDGDSVVYKVKTYDAADAVSPLSAGLTVLASVPANPTLTAPATNATLTSASATATWTVSEQSAYQLRILTSADAVLYTTGKVVSTATSLVVPYSLANGLVDTKWELTTWNNDDLIGTISQTTGVDVTYTAPATPTYTITASNTLGRIRVVIADPAPGATPQVVGHDVFVRVAAGGRQIGERPVGGDGIRIATGIAEDGTYDDYACASGVNYEYRTMATGDNGGVTFGAWT